MNTILVLTPSQLDAVIIAINSYRLQLIMWQQVPQPYAIAMSEHWSKREKECTEILNKLINSTNENQTL
jgi:hypothetical protein